MIEYRTDMADERADIYKRANKVDEDFSGISCSEVEYNDLIKSFNVEIVDDIGAKAIGKPIGKYITYELQNITGLEDDEVENVVSIVSDGLKGLLPSSFGQNDSVLVVGLGNQFVTPDSLGPKVISEIEITRHLAKFAPHLLVKDSHIISAIAPGVLGTTGIETVEIVKGIVDKINPKIVMVVDSLSSNSIDRISKSIQIANTGIIPGSGVNNSQKELSFRTLGIPVIAIGVPMVVDLGSISDIGRKSGVNMIVTPKEIDDLVENMKNIVVKSINCAL